MLTDLWDKFTKVLKHNRGATAAAILTIGLATFNGCQESTRTSPISGEQVTADELATEYNKATQALITEYKSNEARNDVIIIELDGLDEVTDPVMAGLKSDREAQGAKFKAVGDTLKLMPGAEPILPFWPLVTSIFTGGLFIDNRIKDGKIKRDKKKAKAGEDI